MTPLHEHINQVFSDLAFGKEHLEDLVREDLLQMLQFEQRRYSEHGVSTKTAVGAEHMKMRMPSKEIAKRMYCHNGPWKGLEDFFTQPLPEFHHPLLVTGGAKMSSFA